jgi:hypothetical protein
MHRQTAPCICIISKHNCDKYKIKEKEKEETKDIDENDTR